MKKEQILHWVRRLGVPVLQIVLGLILLIRPDTASALIAQILGWVLVLVGAGCAAAGMLSHPANRTSKWLWAAILALAGLWILANPLMLAKMIGRVLGLALMIQGGRDINVDLQYNSGRWSFGPGMVMAVATTVIGLILLVLPLTTSRLAFMVIGIVLICLGVGEIYDRVKGRPGLEAGDPDIIDVEKL